MKSDIPKVLHPICGRPMILWPIRAAQAAGAGRIVVVDGPERRLAGELPEGVELAVQEEPNGTGDAVRSAAEHIGADDTVLVLYGDVPLITAEAIEALARAHEESGAAATMATMELEDPSGYGRVIRASDGSVERVVETKTPGDATAAEEAIREVNTGIYAFAGGDLLEALGRLGSDNAQGELYLPDVLPLLRADGKVVGAHTVTDATLTLGVNTRVDLARVRALRAGAHPPRARPRRGDDRRPGEHARRRRRRDRPRHGDRAEHVPARRHPHRRALHDRPARDADRHDRRRRDADRALLPRRRRARQRRLGRPVRLPAPRRPAARPREGRDVRRDQELRDRRGHEGAAPLLHRGRRHRRGLEPRRRHDHRQLRRRQQAPHDDRRPRQGQRRHHLRRAGDGRRRRLHRRRLGHHRGRAARRAGHRPRAPAQRRGLRRARAPRKER